MDSKAWTCLHCSQRYAYTDQQGKCPIHVYDLRCTDPPQLNFSVSLLKCCVTVQSDTYRASGITLLKNGLTVQNYILLPLLCGLVAKRCAFLARTVCACVYEITVLGLPCIYEKHCLWMAESLVHH